MKKDVQEREKKKSGQRKKSRWVLGVVYLNWAPRF